MKHIVHDTEFEMGYTKMSINYKLHKASDLRLERFKTTPNQFKVPKPTNGYWHQRQLMDTLSSVKCATSTDVNRTRTSACENYK